MEHYTSVFWIFLMLFQYIAIVALIVWIVKQFTKRK